MAQRKEIIEDLSKLLTDKSKLDAYAATLDKQAGVASELNLTQKEAEMAEEVKQEENPLVKELLEIIVPVLDEVKALRAEVAELKSGVAKSTADSPSVSLGGLVKQYLEQGVVKQESGQPDPKQFNTPQHNKGFDDTDLFAQLGSGTFNIKPAKK